MAPATSKATTPKSKSTGAGVKKAARPAGGRRNKARTAMAAMQAYFKENRAKYKSLDFKEQQKKLGEDWKKSPSNPKNTT